MDDIVPVCYTNPKTPVVPEHCTGGYWLKKINSLDDVSFISKNHAYILPDNSIYIADHDGTALIPLSSGGGSGQPTEIKKGDNFIVVTGSGTYSVTINVDVDKIQAMIDRLIEEYIKVEHIKDGLRRHFDAINNERVGTHNPSSTNWIDLVGGTSATLQNAIFDSDYGVKFNGTTSKIFYDDDEVQVTGAYTICNTHKINSIISQHPRIFGENTFPTLYVRTNVSPNNQYGFFAQNKDIHFGIPPVAFGDIVNVALRFSGTISAGGTGTVELFINGVKVSEITSVTANPIHITRKFLGCRSSNDRTLNGSIYDHLLYDRALTDAEIEQNYLASKELYPID